MSLLAAFYQADPQLFPGQGNVGAAYGEAHPADSSALPVVMEITQKAEVTHSARKKKKPYVLFLNVLI